MSYEHWGDSIITDLAHDHPNECALGLSSDGYSVVGASVRGRMHIRNGVHREDALAVRRRDHWLAVAVSDGVGSSKYSRLGASFAVNKVCKNLLDQIGEVGCSKKGIMQWLSREAEPGQEQLEKAMIEGFQITANTLKDHAESLAKDLESQKHPKDSETASSMVTDTTEESNADSADGEITQEVESLARKTDSPSRNNPVEMHDLHCTLLALLLNCKTGTMALAQIGDGLILGLTDDLKATPLIEPQVPGQTGQTYVITQKDWERYFSVTVMPGEESKGYMTVYLMTDGVADDCQYGPPEDILQRWAKDMDSEIRKYDVETTRERLRLYLSEYQAKGSYDDRTLVAVYRGQHRHPSVGT